MRFPFTITLIYHAQPLETHFIMKFYIKYAVIANSNDRFIGSYVSKAEAKMVASMMSEECRVCKCRHWI